MEEKRGLKILNYFLILIVMAGIFFMVFMTLRGRFQNKYSTPNYQMK